MLSDKDACILMEKLKKLLECMVYGTVEVYGRNDLPSIRVTIRSNDLIWNYTIHKFDYMIYNMMLDEYVEIISIRIFRDYKAAILKHFIKDKYL